MKSKIYDFKGTVSIISITTPCKDGNARLTMVPLKVFFCSSMRYILMFIILKLFQLVLFFLSGLRISKYRNYHN